MHNTPYIIILCMMCRCASIHNDMPFTFVWLFSDSSTSSVLSMSSSGKDINMYQHVWKSCFAPGFRDLVPFLGLICCNPFLWVILEWYRNISKCINMYRNVSKCISLPHIFWPSDWKAWGPPWRSSNAIPAIKRLKNWNHIGTQHYNSNEETYKAFQTITKHCKQGNHTKSVQQPSWHLIQPLFEGVSMSFQPRFSGSRMDEAARKTGEFVTNPN